MPTCLSASYCWLVSFGCDVHVSFSGGKTASYLTQNPTSLQRWGTYTSPGKNKKTKNRLSESLKFDVCIIFFQRCFGVWILVINSSNTVNTYLSIPRNKLNGTEYPTDPWPCKLRSQLLETQVEISWIYTCIYCNIHTSGAYPKIVVIQMTGFLVQPKLTIGLEYPTITGWWLNQPIWNILVKLDDLPK